MNEDVILKLEEIFKIDWTEWEACNYAWIATTTYERRYKENVEFKGRMDRAKDYPFIMARRGLGMNVNKWDKVAVVEFLKRRDKRYKDKAEDTVKTEIIDYSGITDLKKLEEMRKTFLNQ